MLELAEIFRVAGPAYEQAHARQMLPSHHRTMHDIVRCRTPALGGSVYACDDCGALDFAYHSCRNRHCPKCQEDRAQQWLERQRARLLPCDHYLLTFTLPYQLRAVARAHQEILYAALLREAAAAAQTLAADPTWVGGTLGILAVLHTWSRTLEYHPHAHLLVTAGGLTPDGAAWVKPAQPRFLMPGYALSQIFRAKMRDALVRAGLDSEVDPKVWQRAWTVHIQQIGSGEHATRYLARYVYHVALTNHRLEHFAHGRVTFRYTHARTRETRRLTLPVDTFITRFLQHVLPRGFTKVRYYGLLSPTGRTDLARARTLLDLHAAQHVRPPAAASDTTSPSETTSPASVVHDSGNTTVDSSGVHLDTASAAVAMTVAIPAARACPVCGRGQLRFVERWRRPRAPPW